MSFFQQLLSARALNRHDGRNIWEYNISESEFCSLKQRLKSSVSIQEMDARDCAIYFAEWWKRCYRGGIPSKKEVLSSLEFPGLFDSDHFYHKAKLGGRLLSYKWISRQNKLYFRTVLLQGGLPLANIANNKSNYEKFLLKILELNPQTIEDFSNDAGFVNLLPPSSRNDAIYENCLGYVRAIIDGDEDFLASFKNDRDVSDITKSLLIKRRNLNNELRRVRNIRALWMLKRKGTHYFFSLRVSVPSTIHKDDLSSLTSGLIENVASTYQLYINEELICSFYRRRDGEHFSTEWNGYPEVHWDGSETSFEAFVVDSSGSRFSNLNLFISYPSSSFPMLLTQSHTDEWMLQKARQVKEDKGFALFSGNWSVGSGDGNIIESQISLAGSRFQLVEFSSSISIVSIDAANDGPVIFRTSAKKVEWVLIGNKPSWIAKANYTICVDKPKIFVYDESGDLIRNAQLRWRRFGQVTWGEWHSCCFPGLIEVQIIVEGGVETDIFFYLGNFRVTAKSADFNSASLEVKRENMVVSFVESEGYLTEAVSEDVIRISLRDDSFLPRTISAFIKAPGQRRALLFEMFSPFEGCEIIDKDGRVHPPDQPLLNTKLNGVRLIANIPHLVIKLFNSKVDSVSITKRGTQSSLHCSLREFQPYFDKLFRLTNIMDSEAHVIFELCVEDLYGRKRVLKSYRIMRFDNFVSVGFDELGSFFSLARNVNEGLLIVPLECPFEKIHCYQANADGALFRPPHNLPAEKFIAFSDVEKSTVQPSFISTNPLAEPTSVQDKWDRISDYKNQLLAAESCNADIWSCLLEYYRIVIFNNLAFSAFDMFMALANSSLLAAKAFVFFTCYEFESFGEKYRQVIEDEIGFCFHWIPSRDWQRAIEWIADADELNELLFVELQKLYENETPPKLFAEIFKYVSTGKVSPLQIHLNARIRDLRQELGEAVLNELPVHIPSISFKYKDIIPVDSQNHPVKLLLKAPVAVALSISEKDLSIWRDSAVNIRRNIMYSQEMNPGWYAEGIVYSLNKINSLL